jgi:hypothetical protein
MMKRIIGSAATIVLLLASCEQEEKTNPFLLGSDVVGHLNPETQVYELDSLFVNDSIQNPVQGDGFANEPGKIKIFEKNGTQLLSLTPTEENDSTATISIIRIIDKRYKTDKGIHKESTFKQISAAYQIASITKMGNQAMVRIKDEDFYFTLDLEELPSSVRISPSSDIDKTQIPDGVKPKFMFVGW